MFLKGGMNRQCNTFSSSKLHENNRMKNYLTEIFLVCEQFISKSIRNILPWLQWKWNIIWNFSSLFKISYFWSGCWARFVKVFITKLDKIELSNVHLPVCLLGKLIFQKCLISFSLIFVWRNILVLLKYIRHDSKIIIMNLRDTFVCFFKKIFFLIRKNLTVFPEFWIIGFGVIDIYFQNFVSRVIGVNSCRPVKMQDL